MKNTENKTETTSNGTSNTTPSNNTNSTVTTNNTVKPSNNNTSNNNTVNNTTPSNNTATNNNTSNNSNTTKPTGCTPVYETITVTDVPAQPIYGEETYLISAEEPIYQERTVYMTLPDRAIFELNQEDDLFDYCSDHSVSYCVTTVNTQVGTKPAQYGTRQVVTGYTEPVTHTEQRQVDCK